MTTPLASVLLCSFAVMVLFVAAFERDGSLALLYPVYAGTFIGAAPISAFAFGTPREPVDFGGMYSMGR
jgi:hypothetical protein